MTTRLEYAHSFFELLRARHCDLRGLRFIEIGCGSGHASAAAADLGAIVTATDYTQIAVDLTAMRLADHGVQASTFVSDLRDPIALELEGAYDFVWCFQVLEHIPRGGQFKALGNLFKMVAPGGYLFIDTENALCPYDRHDTQTWGLRLTKPEIQAKLIAMLGLGINFQEAASGLVQMHDYLTYDELAGAAMVSGLQVVDPFMPHGSAKQYLRVTTGSDWLHDAILQHFPIERFSPINVLLKRP